MLQVVEKCWVRNKTDYRIFPKLHCKDVILYLSSETHFGVRTVRFTNLGPAYYKRFYIQLERDQYKYLKYVSLILGIQCFPHDYTPVSKFLDLKSLANRIRILSKTFLRGLLSNDTDSPALLYVVNLFYTRTHVSFHIILSLLSSRITYTPLFVNYTL